MTQAREKIKPPPPWLLGVILAGSALINIILVERAGFGNEYYAAAVKSMALSWHNFFFGSLDPLGIVSVDKPPLGLWIQVLFVKIFGFDAVALHLPQALAATLSCYVLYRLMTRRFGDDGLGRWCGLCAALVLAVTPIFVAVARNNTMDMLLILTLLLSAWAVTAAADRGSVWLLMTGALLVGLGVNIKMAQALLPLPAFVTVYLLGRKIRFGKKVVHLLCALLVLAVVSSAWMAAVELTPEEDRPYMGGSGNNSAFSLMVDYNGLDRLYREDDGGGAGQSATEGGEPSVVRFFGPLWGGQIAWMMVPAVLSALSVLVFAAVRKRDGILRDGVLWLAWLTAVWAVLSLSSGIVHTYYLAMAAPAIAGCCGLGLWTMVTLYQEHRFLWLLGPGVIVLAGFYQMDWIRRYMAEWNFWLVFAALGAMGCGLTVALLRAAPEGIFHKTKPWVTALAVIALLMTPAVWAVTPIIYGDASPLPVAGPVLEEEDREIQLRSQASDPLLRFLLQNQNDYEAIAIVGSSRLGARLLLSCDEPVIVAGGFNGNDRYITTDELKTMVAQGWVRYMIIDSSMRQPQLLTWANTRRTVPVTAWLGSIPPQGADLPRVIDLSLPAQSEDGD